jgi:hypothetical protein
MHMRYKIPLYVFLLLSPILVPLILIPWAERIIVLVTGDKLDQASRRLAGPNARDCGRIRFDGDARQAKNCTLSAFRDKKPFRMRYQLWDTSFVDATQEVSLVGAQDGHVYELSSWFGFSSAVFGEDVSSERCAEPVAFEARTLGSGKSTDLIECVRLRH